MLFIYLFAIFDLLRTLINSIFTIKNKNKKLSRLCSTNPEYINGSNNDTIEQQSDTSINEAPIDSYEMPQPQQVTNGSQSSLQEANIPPTSQEEEQSTTNETSSPQSVIRRLNQSLPSG
jgi:hypothetical protein